MYKHTQQDYKSPTLDLLEIRLAETICTSLTPQDAIIIGATEDDWGTL